MNLKELTIEGYKSIGKITISNPNPFTVFVGPNASGKSNIFEALEFLELCDGARPFDVSKLFGGKNDFINKSLGSNELIYNVDLGKLKPSLKIIFGEKDDINLHFTQDFGVVGRNPENVPRSSITGAFWNEPAYKHFTNFTRLFVGNSRLVRKNNQDDSRLNTDASNLEKVLKRILKDENKKQEIFEILHLLIPGFESVEIKTEELSGTDSLIVYETHLPKPLPKNLISDGTYNILAIIAALYQSDEPQFLCIEEPENGLNPKVIKELGDVIRDICEEKGHYIWLNTHSQSLVSELTTEEIIIVEKKEGLTKIKQIQGMNLHGLRMDEALYTNSIGGGNPW